MSFFDELKRRNVFRVGLAYLISAWVVAQVASLVFDSIKAPDWVMQALLLLLALGFIVAVIISWAYELTPEGIKKEQDVLHDESITNITAKKLDVITLAAAIAVLALIVWQHLYPAANTAPSLVNSTPSSNSQNDKSNPLSIAVLPFSNMSNDAANEYFSDGISEEILNVLARTPELQVAARTSSFSFKGKAIDVTDIAQALNVRMVLEGSVRKQGDKVRITAQLIDASNGFHLWSETYDRQLIDIFAIQDDIAKAIGAQLKIKMTGLTEPGDTVAGTRNIQAYDLYLQGMGLWQQRGETELWQAIALFEQATVLDPDFVQAYSGLALSYAVIGYFSTQIPFQETMDRAENFAQLAIALDPTQPEAYAALSQVSDWQRRRVTTNALLNRAIALRPSFATAYQWRGTILMIQGKLKEALTSMEHASKLDPRSGIVGENHSIVLLAMGRYADAKARCMQVLALFPDFWGCLEDIALIELQLGNFDAAQRMFDKMAKVIKPSASKQGRELIAALTGKADKQQVAKGYASLAFDSHFDPSSDNAITSYFIPTILVMLGEFQLSLDYLERWSVEEGTEQSWAAVFPMLDPVRCEPRFIALVKKVKMHDPHFARVCGEQP
ncbi:tetratricopeptide repeat protein [Aliiglaciecola litoralis]|uniref:TolB amino-terminal domain-containing protein n=1 Tax=Aliiglaciecola litoralis TaxID=582857 RepID=A0ABP3WTG0_9ALTE